jgi:hypothetical protein
MPENAVGSENACKGLHSLADMVFRCIEIFGEEYLVFMIPEGTNYTYENLDDVRASAGSG